MNTETEPIWHSRRGVRASAGSGKTYDLTGYYLRWLLLGAEPAGMLATTFTRKAAGEILSRVMNRLADACSSEEKLAALAGELAIPGMSLAEARSHLVRLCRALHEVSISTIDSFFGKLLRGFRYELGLPADVRVLDGTSPEIARIRRDAVAAVLATKDKEVLLDLLVDLHRGNASQKVATDLAEQMVKAHEIFQTAPHEAWNSITAPQGLLAPAQLAHAAQALDEAFALLRHSGQKKAATREIGLIEAEQWEALLDRGIAAKLLDGSTSYFAPLPDEVILAYQPIIAHARATLLTRHIAHTRALYRLLALYDEAYREITARERVMLFCDVPLLLARALHGVSADNIAARMDHGIEHLLLDEFQDTDPEQYAVLKPFADTIHGMPQEKGLIYCVGDLKQSIYGWRGATPQIFERFGVDLPDVAWSDNDTSYRSAQAVLQSVNLLFGSLTENPVLADRCPRVAELWQSRFHAHVAKKDLAGFVQLLQSPGVGDPEDETQAVADHISVDPHLEYAAKKIKEIADNAPWASVGVLMRSGAAVRRLIYLLGRLGVAASAEGGSPIADNPAVGIVISALTLADHPSDTAALFHVLNSPLAEPLKLAPSDDRLSVADAALAIRRQLMNDGYASTLSAWASHLAPSCDSKNSHRLIQLVELADTYDQQPGARPMDFVQFARAQSVEEPQPYPVRIMTIHKAKGLEFDSVVLPELQMWLSRPPAIIFSRDPETLRINAVSSYPSRVVQALEPRLAAMYEDYTDQEIRESLCLLYVAMTRARQSLTLIVPALKAKQDGSAGKAPFALSSIVRAGLAGDSALTDLGMPEVLYEHGDCAWYRKPPEREKHDATPAVEMVIPKIDLTGMPLRVRRQITPSSLVDEPADLATEQARRRGIALHAMLAQVAWAGDPLPGDENLLGAARRAAPASSGSELDTCLPVFHALITKPAVQQALSRPILAAGEQIALWRERDFAQIVAGDLVAGTFDRAALVSHNGVLSRATIYDFKTMDCQPSELPALAERYRPQVEMYRAALSAMTGLPLERIAAEIVFTAAGECIPV